MLVLPSSVKLPTVQHWKACDAIKADKLYQHKVTASNEITIKKELSIFLSQFNLMNEKSIYNHNSTLQYKLNNIDIYLSGKDF